MADMMPKKNYDLTEITRLLLEMRENCIPKTGDAYEDPNRAEKYDALNAAIDLINNPSTIAISCNSGCNWISVKDRLPGNGKMAICKTDWFYEVCQWDERSEVWFSTNHIHKKDYVTHWMPLPKPPKEK